METKGTSETVEARTNDRYKIYNIDFGTSLSMFLIQHTS